LVPIEWEELGKGCGKVHIVLILCTHVCKWKNETCSNFRNRDRKVKENGGGGEFKYDIFDIW
jgi:hypothetical protein